MCGDSGDGEWAAGAARCSGDGEVDGQGECIKGDMVSEGVQIQGSRSRGAARGTELLGRGLASKEQADEVALNMRSGALSP